MMHPLRMAYSKVVYKEFGNRMGRDKNPKRTEQVAKRVDALGLSYADFSQIVINMWRGFAIEQGHPYPYWNMVTGDVTFERLETLLELVGDIMGDDKEYFTAYEAEVAYVSAYIDHIINDRDTFDFPRRLMRANSAVRAEAAEAFCLFIGVPFFSDELDYIAGQYKNTL